MTWAVLRKLFLDAVGGATAASDPDIWVYLDQGRQRVISSVEIPQLYETADFTVLAGNDYVALTSAVYHLSTVYNRTDGIPCHEEPDGMGGRNRQLQVTTGKPSTGSVTHWWRDGTKLFVRGTPSADTTLQIRYMKQPATLSDADLNAEPITPPQYDLAIVQGAVSAYLSLHPADNTVLDPERNLTRLQAAEQQFQAGVQRPKEVYREENKLRKESMRLSGYYVTPRSRLGG